MTRVLHTTRDYHLYRLRSLGWELTVCNSLYPAESPCRGVLKINASYGNLLFHFLDRLIPMQTVGRILEVGGGYGYLMKDFLSLRGDLHATMVDISPYLLEQQMKTLQGFQVEFVQADFLDFEMASLRRFDLAILNENLGDFPVLLEVNSPEQSPDTAGEALKRMLVLCNRYDLAVPDIDLFPFNLGAIEAVEKLCLSGIKNIFLSEHSCEATVPDPFRSLVSIESKGYPERIGLYGHDEYTTAFSHLEKVAHKCGYSSTRGPLADFVEFDVTERIRSILKAPSSMNDRHEIIKHFIEDLFKYEYLLLQRAV
jgi:SAM-dependent methyltransferase